MEVGGGDMDVKCWTQSLVYCCVCVCVVVMGGSGREGEDTTSILTM